MGKPKRKSDTKFVAHARRELNMSGAFKKTDDYDGSMGPGILAMVKVFSDWFSDDNIKANSAIDGFMRLLQGELLSPPTTDPDEWEAIKGSPDGTCRNKRNQFFVSTDFGKTWMHLQTKERGNSRDHITGKDVEDAEQPSDVGADGRIDSSSIKKDKESHAASVTSTPAIKDPSTPPEQTNTGDDQRSGKSSETSSGSGLDSGVESQGKEDPRSSENSTEESKTGEA